MLDLFHTPVTIFAMNENDHRYRDLYLFATTTLENRPYLPIENLALNKDGVYDGCLGKTITQLPCRNVSPFLQKMSVGVGVAVVVTDSICLKKSMDIF